jgi:hypothetical protein
MNVTVTRITSAVILSLGCAASAHAEYRCEPPPTWIDQRACQAAAESPQALRQFVQRMRWITNLQFSDYVNEDTALAWESQERDQAARRTAEDSAEIAADSELG